MAADATYPASEIIDRVTELVAKSLVTADVGDAEPRFRLLETTRAYALTKLAESGEVDVLGRRHAAYYRGLLKAAAKDKSAADDWAAAYAPEIGNVRAALAWAFAPGGDASIGVALATASAPVWLGMWLWNEWRGWVEKAISSLDAAAARGTRDEMVLNAALGQLVITTRGMTNEAEVALMKALELAERLRDPDYQLRILHALWAFFLRLADYRNALAMARQFEAVAKGVPDPVAMPTADRIIGLSLYFLGDQASARAHLARALDEPPPASRRAYAVRFGIDQRVNALVGLAQILWLQGFPDQAVRTGKSSIDEAQALEHPVSLCPPLAWGGSVVAVKTLTAAEAYTAKLIEHAEKHSLSLYDANSLGVRGWLSAKRGDPGTGVQLLRAALGGLRIVRYYIFYTMFLGDLAEVLGAVGRVDEGLGAIDEALERVEGNQEFWYMPEALRIKGELLLLQNQSDAAAATDHFFRSLDLANRQGALSWELRTGMSLARLKRGQGRVGEACELLASVYDRFTEGFGTADLQTAKQLLAELTERKLVRLRPHPA